MGKVTYQAGQILLADLGAPPKEIVGHEQGYPRPVLVVKAYRNLLVVLPITSSTPQPFYSHTVMLKKGQGGLTNDSFVLCHQIRSISVDRIIKPYGSLDTLDLEKIRTVLIDMFEE